MPDEVTPHERGILTGHQVAGWIVRAEITFVTDEGASLEIDDVMAVLSAGIVPPPLPADLIDAIMVDGETAQYLAESDDPDAETEFWDGFATGVNAFIVQLHIGNQN